MSKFNWAKIWKAPNMDAKDIYGVSFLGKRERHVRQSCWGLLFSCGILPTLIWIHYSLGGNYTMQCRLNYCWIQNQRPRSSHCRFASVKDLDNKKPWTVGFGSNLQFGQDCTVQSPPKLHWIQIWGEFCIFTPTRKECLPRWVMWRGCIIFHYDMVDYRCQNGLVLMDWPRTGLILSGLGLELVQKTITMAWPSKGLGLV